VGGREKEKTLEKAPTTWSSFEEVRSGLARAFKPQENGERAREEFKKAVQPIPSQKNFSIAGPLG